MDTVTKSPAVAISHIALTVNGQPQQLELDPRTSLLDALREHLHLTGTKEGCGEGECGSCSVLLNGELVNSCLIPALQANGATICSIEGVAREGHLHPIQQCFLAHGGADIISPPEHSVVATPTETD